MADADTKMEESEEIVVYYWPIPFRGNFAKLLLADAGAAYRCASREEVIGLLFAKATEQPTPMFAPPAISVGAFHVNQTPAAVVYLAKKFGYEPETPEESAVALKTLSDCNDILAELTRNNGHQMWDEEAWTTFVGNRLVRWLSIIDGVAAGRAKHKSSADGDWCFGAKISYADFAIAHIFSMIGLSLGMKAYLEKNAPAAWALTEKVRAREGVAKLYEEQAKSYGTNTCGGQIQKSIVSMVALGIHNK